MAPDAAALARRYRWIAAAGAALLLLLLSLLILREYRAAEARALDMKQMEARRRLAEVEAIVHGATVHVRQMRMAMQRELILPATGRQGNLLPEIGGDEILVSSKPPEGEAHRRGILLASPQTFASRPASDPELLAVEQLFLLQGAAHATNPDFAWSYYFSASRDFVAIFPWAPPSRLLAGEQTAFAALLDYFDSDVYRLTTIGSDPERRSVWSPVFVDAAGRGLMVSHGAPVDVAGRQIGMVGTDLVLQVFADRLQLQPDIRETFVLVDGEDVVLADSHGLSAGETEVTKLDQITQAQIPAQRTGESFVRGGSDYVLSLPVPETPWRLLSIVPRSAIGAAAQLQVLPYLAFLALLTLALGAIYAVVTRLYIDPALALVRIVERVASGRPEARPPMPAMWHPWVDRIVGAFRSLAESNRRLAEERLKSRAVIDAALNAVVTADRETRVIDFNPAAERMFGYTAEEARGRSISELMVPEPLRAAHDDGVVRYAQTRVPHILGRRVEMEARRADGQRFPIELQVQEIDRDVARETGVRYSAYIRDLTEQKRIAAENFRNREKLHQAEKLSAMGSLLAGLAHELNNPLAVVTAQATLLEELAADPADRARSAKIRAAAERCGRIVRTFLSMARQQGPKWARTNLKGVVEQALEIGAYGLRSSGVELHTRFADVPEIEADEDQLAQVFLNLIVNAQQALNGQAGERHVWIEVGEEGEDALFVSVADNGPGIPENSRQRIFEPFFTTKPAGLGLGVGLAVSKNIVAAHSGTIAVDDRPGGGTVFKVVLPLAEAAHAGDGDETARAGMPARALTILIVDDEPDVAASLAQFMQTDGHRAVVAQSIDEASDILDRRPFDAVFCDLRMPHGEGTQLLTRLRAEGSPLAARFVFVTGDMVAGPPTMAAASPGEPPTILAKPFGRAEVRALLEELASRGGDVAKR